MHLSFSNFLHNVPMLLLAVVIALGGIGALKIAGFVPTSRPRFWGLITCVVVVAFLIVLLSSDLPDARK